MTKPLPDGFHSLTPHLTVTGAAKAIEFYKKAFGAQEIMRIPMPDGRLGHAQLKIGDSMIMMADTFPEMGGCRSPLELGGSHIIINLYVPDCDQVFNQAIAAGAAVRMPLADMFWGDRYGQLTDPFGHVWAIATHKEDVPPAELGKRAQAAMANMDKGK
jgi:PhnB protein